MFELFPSKQAGQFGRRLRRERGARVPVTIVTGFLGAGKTTIVRRFLESPEGYGTAVIVNEFGAVGIDDALVRASSDETVLLGNGCLCCTTRTDLQIAIRTLISERERGAIPSFARILIETSGLADPGPILQTFATDRALGTECFVEVVVTVVDAVSGLATLDWSAEARKQAILADRLVVSKPISRMTPRPATCSRDLRELNPHAAVDVAVGGNIDPRCSRRNGGFEARTKIRSESGHHGFVAEAVHTDDIRSFVMQRSGADPLGGVRTGHEGADRTPRSRPAARQRLSECRGLPRAGAGAVRAASRPPAGGTGVLAGGHGRQSPGFHHARHCGTTSAGLV